MSEYEYDFDVLQKHLSESQNLMIRKLEQANRAFEKAMEGMDGVEKNDDCPTLCPTLQNSRNPL